LFSLSVQSERHGQLSGRLKARTANAEWTFSASNNRKQTATKTPLCWTPFSVENVLVLFAALGHPFNPPHHPSTPSP
jgi:hypothetical protein